MNSLMVKTVLIFLVCNHNTSKVQVLLGTRKTGEGIGQYNGIGGKCEPHETLIDAAIREVKEEINVNSKPQDLIHIAHITFQQPVEPCTSDVFVVYKWQGIPQPSKEIMPQWFDIDKIPYRQMWPNDELWFPKVLKGDKFTATFWRDENGQLLKHDIKNTILIN